MQSQIQCPVCTLYLHVGMNLQMHLDTHPKDQVIAALVNFTLLQHNSNDTINADSGRFECTTYEPLSQSSTTATTTTTPPPLPPPPQTITQETPNQIDNSNVLPLAYTSASASQPTTSANLLKKSTSTNLPYNGSQSLPPPPPYEASYSSIANHQRSVLRNFSQSIANNKSADISITQTTIKNQEQPKDSPTGNFIQNHNHNSNAAETLEIARPASVIKFNRSYAPQKQKQTTTTTTTTFLPVASVAASVPPKIFTAEISPTQKKSGLRILSDVKLNPIDNLNVTQFNHHLLYDAISMKDIFVTPNQNSINEIPNTSSSSNSKNTKIEFNFITAAENSIIANSAQEQSKTEECDDDDDDDDDDNDNDNQENAESISILQLDIKNESTNNQQNDEKPLIELDFRSNNLSTDEISVETNNQNETNKITDLVSDAQQQQQQQQLSNQQISVIKCANIDENSMVIASDVPATTMGQSHHAEPLKRTFIKKPFLKAPKRLIVKFKKPIVAEMADENRPQTSKYDQPKIKCEPEISIDSVEDVGTILTEPSLCCPEIDVPFSPLRDSFTPCPLNILDGAPPETQPTTIVDGMIFTSKIEDILDRDLSEQLDENIKDLETIIIDNEHAELKMQPSCTELIANLSECKLQINNEWADADFKLNPTSNNTLIDIKSYSILNGTTTTTTTTTGSTGTSTLTTATIVSPPQSQYQYTIDVAGPSNLNNYGLASFLDYAEPANDDGANDFYSNVPLSPIECSTSIWNEQRFGSTSTSYVPFNTDRSSYVDLDSYNKNTMNSNYCERAQSMDSCLNIRTDEKMPAKGEISEQESNGDIDGSWSHQIFPLQDALPRYTSSYDTTVARESWSLSNDQNFQQNLNNLSTVLPKFTPLINADQDLKPNLIELDTKMGKVKTAKARRYRCPECPKAFAGLKEKRSHLVDIHNYQQHKFYRRVTCTTTSAAGTGIATTSTATISGLNENESIPMASSFLDVKIKSETNVMERIRNMNQHLLNYNWTVLRQKLTQSVNDDVKIPIMPTENNIYMCLVCHERFFSIKSFSAHFDLHPAECYTCGRTFKHWVNFSIHLKRHLNIKEYGCSQCTKRFVLRQNLIEHMNTHTGDTPFQCKFCSKRFRRYSNLVQHRNRHHLNIRPREKDYICQCGEVYHSVAKFAWHKETHDKKPKCCPYCRERFIHRNSLSRHVRLSHAEYFHMFNNELVNCPICSKRYIKSSLKNHLTMHTSKIKYECNICNKSFTTKWNLKQHKWIHASRSLKPFKCTMCTKAFIRESEYISHVNTHKSIKPFTCDHCGCQFARKYNWLRHAREHEIPKRHRCDDCGKEFHRAYYLTEHRRSHTGERPFECVICGKTSTTKTNHNKHVKIHHARDPLTAEG